MIVHAIIFVSFALYVIGYKTASGKERLGLGVLLIGLYPLSQILLTEFKILGPVSIRIPLIFLVAVIAGQTAVTRVNRAGLRKSVKILIPYALMLVWSILTEFVGTHGSYETPMDFALKFPPKFLVGPVFLISFCILVRTPHQMRFVIGAMILPVMISSVVGVMQYMNISLGDYLHDTLRPESTAELRRKILNYNSISTMGLAGSPIEFITSLTTLAPIGVAYFLVETTNKLRLIKVASIGLFLVASALLVICGSRSGVLGVAFSAALLVLWTPRSLKGFKVGRNIVSVFVIVSLVLLIYSSLSRFETRVSKSHRVSNLADNQRVELTGHALWAIKKAPIFGFGGAKFNDQFGVTPHNGLLNSGVYWGIPAMIACFFCYIVAGMQIYSWLFSSRQLTQLSWMTVAGGLCVMVYLWHGMTHNASPTSGGTLFFMVCGIPVISWEMESALRRQHSSERVDYYNPQNSQMLGLSRAMH